MIKFGVIGCGNIGSKRILSSINYRKSKLIIVCDNSLQKKKIFKIISKKKIKTTDNWKDLLILNLDAIILSTGVHNFYKIASNILKNKINLLIEKPLGKNLIEARKLKNLAIKNKVLLKTGYNHRFDSGIIKAKELLSKNSLGKVYNVKMIYGNGTVITNKNRIGSLLDLGSHMINLSEFFFNTRKFDSYLSIKQSREMFNKNDDSFILIKKNRIPIFIHESLLYWKNTFLLEFICEKGYLKIDSLPKWGKQKFEIGRRVYPSGVPIIKKFIFYKDNSWINEWVFFVKNINSGDKIKKNIINEGYDTMKNCYRLI
jgi:predicted dehydrogenase